MRWRTPLARRSPLVERRAGPLLPGAGGAPAPTAGSIAPLYAAGFVTAFGAHAVASTLGAEAAGGTAAALLRLGLLVAVYDLAEVLLKPVFGSIADRVGPKRVVLGGLIAFAVVSTIGGLVPGSWPLVLVRFGQGAAAAAFSPAASAAVARLASPSTRGRYFGRYGSWKSLGYASGPVVGASLASAGGQGLLQAVLALVAVAAALWVAARCPTIEPLPRKRATVVDVVRRSTSWSFVQPVIVLSASAGALVAAVGFLPASAGAALGLVGAAAVATVTALASTAVQPLAGRLLDRRQVSLRSAGPLALAVCASGAVVAALAVSYPMTLCAATLIGVGVGSITPIAYATLAARTADAEMGRTMGAAELGRELGDAGAPTLVGLAAGVGGVSSGLLALAGVLLAATVTTLLPAAGRARPGRSAR